MVTNKNNINKINKNRGKFIVIEGGDGCGKSTVIEYLKEKFKDDKNIIFTREPGGTDFGEEVREIFLHSKNKNKISVLTELFIFCALRANHCDLFLRPYLEKGKTIISDRFDPATIAYQIYGYSNNKLAKIFKNINQVAKGFGTAGEIKPDLVIYLDIDPEVGLARTGKRGTQNRLDGHSLTFHQKVRNGYLAQMKRNKNWVKINASESKKEVREKVEKVLTQIITD